MDAHGRRDFEIDGEGSTGSPEPDPARLRGPVPAGFRFSRIGPRGRPVAQGVLVELAKAMTLPGGGSTGIPAGYTYLGQFLDHDLTFDATTVTLGEHVGPGAMLQGRSPALDLDSLYGAGPLDEASEGFYEDDLVHLRTGTSERLGSDPEVPGGDLPRSAGRSLRARRRANVPDARNDENLAVAQTHAMMIRFHNRVVDSQPRSTPPAAAFVRARRQVVKHYQWMVRTDYLPRICDPAVVEAVFRDGRALVEPDAAPRTMPRMPVEFSVAAFRLGHSMVRASYSWNRRFPDGSASLGLLFTFSGTSGNLGGGARLPSNWVADWRRLYDFTEAGRDDLAPPRGEGNRAMRIDTRMAAPLGALPQGSFGGRDTDAEGPQRNLAFRNLTRATMVRLASGQQMVQAYRDAGVALKPLTRKQILEGREGATLGALTARQKQTLVDRTPLWFYVLREAELNGGVLDGVGARIVTETFHRAIEGSRTSIVRDPGFRPSLGPDDRTFRMVDLVLAATGGRKNLVNPLGGR